MNRGIFSLLVVFLGAGPMTACEDGGLDRGVDQSFVRLSNVSSVDFDEVVVVFPSQPESYGALRSGTVSEYRSIGLAYRYARIDVRVGGQMYRIQPIDYVGEEPLRGGLFTYTLGLSEDQLSFEFQRD